ncbi:MAG: hypothetical protein EA360_01610 [Balneolaceae bacterium]|nr:MAG: hypothetical protein EA360_01610 [Balneolaceae bacterium]
MITATIRFLALLVISLPMTFLLHAQTLEITVSAGGFERSGTIVTFYLPMAFEPGHYQMVSEQGEEVILQVSQENQGTFLLPSLAAGETVQYSFTPSQDKIIPAMEVVTGLVDNQIVVSASGSEVLRYYSGLNNPPAGLDARYQRSGYIHPLLSPSGVVLTNHLNEDQHPHHSGIWSAWTQTVFEGRTPDFWNIHQNSGRVDGEGAPDSMWDGVVHAGFISRHRFVDLSAEEPVVALNEEWKVEAYPLHDGSFHLFDLTVTQTTNSDSPLFLPEYRYGGVGFRGHADWDNPDLVQFLTSEGQGREGHATRVRWTHIGGLSDGNLAGLTIMDHPSNPRFPQTVRIHPDEPFFNYAPVQLGDMEIRPGSPYTVRYRYVTYDGEPDVEKIEALWRDFAYPPGVTVRRL